MDKTILLTNDDGYKCIGFLSLLNKLKKEYNVVPVAPSEGKSWIGKAITPEPIKVEKVKAYGSNIYSVSGTPADCSQIGVYNLSDNKPDLVVSGINIGENVGLGWILSSGTVGGAIEAFLQGVQSIAVSYRFPLEERVGVDFYDEKNCYLYENASILTKKVVDKIIDQDFDKEVDFFIVNIPYQVNSDAKFEITKPYRGSYKKLFYENNGIFTHKTKVPEYKNLPNCTDLKAVGEGRVSITPVKIELTSDDLIEKIKGRLSL